MLDVGCGAGTLLLDIVSATVGARGLGVDLSASAVSRARRAARARGLADRAEFEVGDAAARPLAADVIVCSGSSHAVGGLPRLLDRARAGHLLLGEGFWHGAPPPEWRGVFGDLPDGLAGLAEQTAVHGWRVVSAEAADPWEWDAFEQAWGTAVRSSGLPGATALADRRWSEYVTGYRGRLGFGWLLLGR